MDRKYSDPTIWDNSIDSDDKPDGSEGGYDRHGNYIISAAMQEIVALRKRIAELKAQLVEARELLLGTIPIEGAVSDWYKRRDALLKQEK